MELSVIQIILICIGAVIVWDVIRLLFLKILSKKIRIFSIVPDTEQARLSFISKKLGVPVTEIIYENNTYVTVDNPDVVYKISCVPEYVLIKDGEEISETEIDNSIEDTFIEDNSIEDNSIKDNSNVASENIEEEK